MKIEEAGGSVSGKCNLRACEKRQIVMIDGDATCRCADAAAAPSRQKELHLHKHNTFRGGFYTLEFLHRTENAINRTIAVANKNSRNEQTCE